MKKLHKNFTLIETIVGVAIFGLLMVSVTRIAINIQRSWADQFMTQAVMHDGRWLVEFFSNDLRFAYSGGGFRRIRLYDNGTRIRMRVDTNNNNSGDTYVRYEIYSVPGHVDGGTWVPEQKTPIVYRSGTTDDTDMAVFAANLLDGTAMFTNYGNGLIGVNAVLRARPDKPADYGNQNIVIRTMVRARN
ncbi:MAG: type II secretion system protein [Candidatus Omnitrophica bacterium]|nr:type II secretion system protein [Candidatus Omnitrophota bacterium]